MMIPKQIRKKYLLYAALIVLMLCIPATAMQFTEEVNWSAFDFLAAGVLLTTLAICLDLAITRIQSKKLRTAGIMIIVIVFLLTWVELAVGVLDKLF